MRTSVEGLNLSVHCGNPDALAAECWRTFPTVTFPAQNLLHREEVETCKVAGRSIIATIHGHKTNTKYTYAAPPSDLVYGFRGFEHNIDLMCPFEVWRFWRLEKALLSNYFLYIIHNIYIYIYNFLHILPFPYKHRSRSPPRTTRDPSSQTKGKPTKRSAPPKTPKSNGNRVNITLSNQEMDIARFFRYRNLDHYRIDGIG